MFFSRKIMCCLTVGMMLVGLGGVPVSVVQAQQAPPAAQNIPPQQQGGAPAYNSYGYEPPLGNVTIPQLIARIIGQILPLVGALFFVMFLWGGFLWFSAGGDETKVKKARQTLTNAVIGMAIVMGAYILVFNIISTLGKAIGQ